MPRSSLALITLACLLACSAGDPPTQPRHLLLVTVDTLRADRLGAYGYAPAHTPTIDALAARGIRFERAYAHSSMTLPSMASLFTGRLPAEHRIFRNGGRLQKRLPTLVERLHESGFETGAFVGSYALRSNRGFDRGFDHYTREYHAHEEVRRHPENRAAWLTDEALAWLAGREGDARTAVWIHYQEPHGPYVPRAYETPAEDGVVLPRGRNQSGRGAIPAYQWLGHGRLAEYEARYDGEVAEVDRELGRLLESLASSGRLASTLVVFTADHGEAFGEDDLYCAHGEGLSEVLLRVPLLLAGPGIAPAVRDDAVRQIDVAPTVLSLLGAEVVPFPGRSLLRDEGDREVVAQLVREGERWRGLRTGRAWLREDTAGSELAVHDEGRAAQPADPELEGMRERLAREAPWPEPLVDLLSAEEIEALRAMGYAE